VYEATWLLSAGRAIGESPADVAIGVIPSLSGGVLAWLAQRRFRIPFGLIFQDLMSAAAQQSGYAGGSTLVKPARVLEGFLAQRAGAAALGVRDERIFRVRNWTRPATSAESKNECRRRLGWSNADFICLHAGNMGVKQGLDTLLATAQLLGTERVRVVFAGSGNDRDRLEREARKRNLHNV
jgi:hypothetical protein